MVPALKATDGPRCRSAGDRGFLDGLATTDIALLDVVLGVFLPVLGSPPFPLVSRRVDDQDQGGWNTPADSKTPGESKQTGEL
jgi:hypothetical protein